MQIQCNQVVLTLVIDEEIYDKETQFDICRSLHKNRTIFAGSINKDGSTIKYDKLRITSITEDRFLDIISMGATHSLTLKKVPFDYLVRVSVTSNNPVDNEEIKNLTIQDFLDI